MSPIQTWPALLWEKVQQVQQNLSRVVLDTITTRFFMLFLFIMTIPLMAVILFTVSLLGTYLDQEAQQKVQSGNNLLIAKISQQGDQLKKVNQLISATANSPAHLFELCQTYQGQCLILFPQQQQVQLPQHSPQSISKLAKSNPDLAWLNSISSEQHQVFAYWEETLYQFSVNPTTLQNQPVIALLGQPLNQNLLHSIFMEHPNLDTSLWLLKDTTYPKESQWIAHASNTRYPLPREALLAAIHPTQSLQTVSLDGTSYQASQSFLYGPDQQKLARIISLQPLSLRQQLMQNYYVGIYLIAVGGLLFSMVIAMIAGRPITLPLLKLIQQVNQINHDNKGEITVQGVYEINQLTMAFNRMLRRLQQEHQMKDEFVATLTHDLKVPLLAEKQTLAYFAQGSYGPLTEDQAEVVDILRSSNQSCLSLVNGILQVYRYESGTIALKFETVSLHDVLQEVVNELMPLVREKSLNLSIKAPETPESTTAFVDRLEIKRALQNLISNAITNTPKHGRIQCLLETEDTWGMNQVYKVSSFEQTTLKHPLKLKDRILVSIQDSGIGFSIEDLPNLFQQFAISRGRNPMSIGLGLYNCYQVIQAQHGSLWVETTEGKGSAVNFTLPRTEDTARDRRKHVDRRTHPTE